MSCPATRLARFSSVSSLNSTDGAGARGCAEGTPAPDFTLRDQFGQDVDAVVVPRPEGRARWSSSPGRSPTCAPSEMAGIRDRLDEFLTFDTEVLAISTDPTYSLRVFADTDGLNFPLLSDFWPHGAVASAYGVFDADLGVARRSSFVDRQGRDRALGGAQRSCPTAATWTSTWPTCTNWPRPAGSFSINWPFDGVGTAASSVGTVLLVEPLVTRDASGSTHFPASPCLRCGRAPSRRVRRVDGRPGVRRRDGRLRQRKTTVGRAPRRRPRAGSSWRATTCTRPPTSRRWPPASRSTDDDRWPWLEAIGRWIDDGGARAPSAVLTCSALRRTYRDLLRDGRPERAVLPLPWTPTDLRERLAHRTRSLHAGVAPAEPARDPRAARRRTSRASPSSAARGSPSVVAEARTPSASRGGRRFGRGRVRSISLCRARRSVSTSRGRIAQLVERLPYKEDVRGSSPFAPTSPGANRWWPAPGAVNRLPSIGEHPTPWRPVMPAVRRRRR